MLFRSVCFYPSLYAYRYMGKRCEKNFSSLLFPQFLTLYLLPPAIRKLYIWCPCQIYDIAYPLILTIYLRACACAPSIHPSDTSCKGVIEDQFFLESLTHMPHRNNCVSNVFFIFSWSDTGWYLKYDFEYV